jgi:ubiquinone/menaquinone biosynthesis C-methylase UbiE
VKYRSAEFWSNRVDTYESDYNLDSAACIPKRRRKASMLINWTGMDFGKKVLELGCGTGLYTKYFAMTGCDLTATDFSAQMVLRTCERIRFRNVEFIQSDACDLQFADDSFDIVVGAYLMQHLDTIACMHEIKRVTRKGGKVGFIVPNIMNPISFIYANNWTKLLVHEKSITINHTIRQWHKILKDNNFVDIKTKIVEFMPSNTPEMLIPICRTLTTVCESLPIVNQFGGTLVVGATNAD